MKKYSVEDFVNWLRMKKMEETECQYGVKDFARWQSYPDSPKMTYAEYCKQYEDIAAFYDRLIDDATKYGIEEL